MRLLKTVEMKGPAGRIIVNEDDVEQWKRNGFALIEPKGAAKADGLDEMTVPQLRDIATKNGVNLEGLSKKNDIVKAIRAGVSQDTEHALQE